MFEKPEGVDETDRGVENYNPNAEWLKSSQQGWVGIYVCFIIDYCQARNNQVWPKHFYQFLSILSMKFGHLFCPPPLRAYCIQKGHSIFLEYEELDLKKVFMNTPKNDISYQ